MKKYFLKSSLFIALSSIFMTNTITFEAIEKNINNNTQKELNPIINDFETYEEDNIIIQEKNNETYILINKNTGEEITDIYETLNAITKKLSVEEALNRLNKMPISELDNDNKNIENHAYIEEHLKKQAVLMK